MRLLWPFGRSTADPADTDTNASAGRPAAPIPFAPEPTRSTGAWAALPPIQRAVGSPPLVAPSDAFFEAVPGVHPLPPILETLGHDVTTLAPTGLVGAPAHAVASLTSSAALVPPPVQRRAEAAAAEVPALLDEPGPASSAAPAPDTASAAPAPADPPVRQLGVVTPSATVRPPDRSLTRADPPASPDRSDHPLVSRRTQVQTSSPAAPAAAPTGGPPTSAGVATPPDAAPSPGSGSTPGPRRFGLGAPLPAAPGTAVSSGSALPGLAVSRLAGGPLAASFIPSSPASSASLPLTAGRSSPTSPIAGAAPLRTTIQRRTIGARTASADDEPADSETADPASPAPLPPGHAPSLPVLRVVGQPRPAAESGEAGATTSAPSHTGSSPSSASASTASAVAADRPTRSTATAGAAIAAHGSGVTSLAPALPPVRRPLVGRQPIGQSGSVQRSATEGETAAAPTVGPTAQAEVAAPAWNWSLESAGGGGGPVGFGSIPELPVPAAIASRPSHQRPPSASSGSPALTMPAARQGSVHRAPTAPMTFDRPSAPTALPLAAPTVARTLGPEAQGPTFQASPSAPAPSAPVLAPTATPVIQRVDASAPPPPSKSGGGERSDDELDELARALFGRFRNRLRNEYIYEREAKGLTFDQA